MTNNLKKIVGQRLKLLRLEKKLTQEQMGEKLSLSTSAYCKIEYGETELTISRLMQIAEALEMPPGELFNKIEGSYFSSSIFSSPNMVRVVKEGATVNIDNNNDLRELIKTNARLIESLFKQIEILEEKIKKSE